MSAERIGSFSEYSFSDSGNAMIPTPYRSPPDCDTELGIHESRTPLETILNPCRQLKRLVHGIVCDSPRETRSQRGPLAAAIVVVFDR